LVTGHVSTPAAMFGLAAHCVVLLTMIRETNTLAWYIGLATLFPLAGIYPFCKRVLSYPQVCIRFPD
jgi:4-hydroxybenzoate polyprenyltransferase